MCFVKRPGIPGFVACLKLPIQHCPVSVTLNNSGLFEDEAARSGRRQGHTVETRAVEHVVSTATPSPSPISIAASIFEGSVCSSSDSDVR